MKIPHIKIAELVDIILPPDGVGTDREKQRIELNRKLSILIGSYTDNIPIEPDFSFDELIKIYENIDDEKIKNKIGKFVRDLNNYRKGKK